MNKVEPPFLEESYYMFLLLDNLDEGIKFTVSMETFSLFVLTFKLFSLS